MAPVADKVRLSCKDRRNEIFDVEYPWLVSYHPPHHLPTEEELSHSSQLGFDYDTLAVNDVKYGYFVKPKSDDHEKEVSSWKDGKNYDLLKGKNIVRAENTYAYIRIFSFACNDADLFVEDFTYILQALREEAQPSGLIIDIRGNGGGLIPACEQLLAKLSGKDFAAQQFQFIHSDAVTDLCMRHSDDDHINLQPWRSSLIEATSTGEIYSFGSSISDIPKSYHKRKLFGKKIALITNGLCYSAADMLAAGFKDLGIGKILGVHNNTGAGGANVWTHSLLQNLAVTDDRFESLPKGARMSIAIRRILRRNGSPLEDLGVRPDYLLKMTWNDLMEGNIDLIDRAIGVLESRR